MKKKGARTLRLSLSVLLLGSAAFSQSIPQPHNTGSVAGCEPGTCISKDLNLTVLSTPVEVQDLVNTLRTVVDITHIHPNPYEHSVFVKGTPEQLAIADRVVNALATLRASGGQKPSSVLVYQPNGLAAPPTVPDGTTTLAPQTPSTLPCELTTCFIKALYLPAFSTLQLQNAVNRLRRNLQITRITVSPSIHVVVFRGTSEQVALAERVASD